VGVICFLGLYPALLLSYGVSRNQASLWTFLVIAIGAAGCIAGGLASGKFGNARIASAALLVSGCCCLLSGLFFQLPWPVFLMAMLVWGAAVIADSPQFSALVANAAPPHLKGTALSIVTSIGFTITIISIAVLETVVLQDLLPVEWIFLVLSPGPLFGLIAMFSVTFRKGKAPVNQAPFP
jgi:MFS family permease